MLQQFTPEQALTELKSVAQSFGFDAIGVLNVEHPHPALETAGDHLTNWLKHDFNGSMSYMSRHGSKRWRPTELHPGTTRVITVRLHYLNMNNKALDTLKHTNKAYISRYALGRDYHKTLRQRLKKLTNWIEDTIAPKYHQSLQSQSPLLTQQPLPQDKQNTRLELNSFTSRVFVDSAPVMEKATAEAAGLGWIGKNTLVIDTKAGSWFFLGEIYTNIPIAPTSLPLQHNQSEKNQNNIIPTINRPTQQSNNTIATPKNHCGTCTRCIEVCPTQAIIAPYKLDARRCISYLTIENKGSIPEEFRAAIGNRIFGCDDCQLFCPWNRFAQYSHETDFTPRHNLDQISILEGLRWTANDFHEKTQGSPIKRTGYYGWLRNLAVAAGNAPYDRALQQQLTILQTALQKEQEISSSNQANMVLEHLDWAQVQQTKKS